AETSGFTNREIKEKFAAEYAAVDRSRGAAVPEEYNQSSVRYATLANLPHDRSTVTALAKVQASIQRGPRRVTRAALPHRSSFIHEAGYDNGRLEITFKANPNAVYAYRDVPSSVWDRMQEGSAGSIFAREVRGNSDYQYDSAEEAETDAYTVRCSSCGQFAARTGHSCPQRVERERLENETGVATPSIDEVIQNNPDIVINETEAGGEEASENVEEAPSEVSEEAPYVDPETVVDADADESDDAIATPVKVEEEPVVEESKPDEVEMLDDMNGLLTIVGPVNMYPEHVPTPANQRNPEPFSVPENSVIEKTVKMSRVETVQGSPSDSRLTSGYYLGSMLSEKDKQLIRNTDSKVKFIIGAETYNSETATILDIYKSSDFFCEVKPSYCDGYDENGDAVPSPSRYVLTRQPIRPEFATYTRQEKNEILEQLSAKIRTQIESGKAVAVASNTSFTRKFKIDGNDTEGTPIKFAKTTDFRNAIKDGKTAVVDTEWRLPYTSNRIDDQGHFAGHRGIKVSGEMAFKRNADGLMEVVSDERSLRCNCTEYRTKYNCHHLNYVQRHAGNVAQQNMPAERTHRLLTAALSGRPDVSVVEPKNGNPFIRFNSSHLTPARRGWNVNAFAVVPENMRPADPDSPTHAEVLEIQNAHIVINSINKIYTPATISQVRSAVRRADVEMPVRVTLVNRNDTFGANISVTGNLNLHNGEDGQIEVTGHTLKCTCSDYAENYDCIHVRTLAEQRDIFLNVNGRTVNVENSMDDFQRNNVTIWRDAREIGRHMRRYNLTQEEATDRIVSEREEAERRRREYDERRRIEHERFEAQQRIYREERERERQAERARLAEQQAELAGEYEEYRKNRIKAWENVETPYAENPAEFKKAMDEALARKKKGQSAVVFQTENVTDGVAGDGPGTRAFGVELEFDIKQGVDRRLALRKIGEELYAAGLTNTSRQTYYHSAAENGYQKWSFEEDCTVDAELVSPIMKDTPEHWEELRQVIEIVERNGGVASTRAGSHVHVSSGSYQTKVAPHAELLRTFNANEDIMYRMAADPKRGKHRGTRWCAPNANDPEQEISKDDARSIRVLEQYDHALGLNFESADNNNWKKANVEFRLWDSTLDAGVIQQQVAVSVAMTDYAERKVETEGTSKKSEGERRTIGHGRQQETNVFSAHGVDKHNDQTFAESHAEAAAFFDKMFRTKKQRDAAASLFALNKWQMR
nr:amidoligase family protein [Enterococcus sp.]